MLLLKLQLLQVLLLLLLLNTTSSRYVLSSDLGTESCRTGIFDCTSGQLIKSVSIAYKSGTSYPEPGYAEQHPHDWWDALGKGCRQAIEDSNIDVNDVLSICIDTTACSVVALDSDFKPLRPCLLWMDTRASAQCIEILEKGKDDDSLIVNCNGNGPLSAEWMIPKAYWIKQNEPSVWLNAKYICEKQDYINHCLTGKYIGSGCNVAARWHWNLAENVEESRPITLLKKLQLDDLLEKWPTKIVGMGKPLGFITEEAKNHLGLGGTKNDITVVQGGPDAYVGMIGLGVTNPGKLALITGSSHLQLAVTSSKKHADGIWGSYQGSLPLNLSFAEGGQSSTGSVLQWIRRLVDTSLSLTLKDLDEEAGKIPIGSEGLIALDSFQGSRTPITNPYARGAIIGLTLSHKRGNVFRAFLEAICYGTRACFDALKNAGFDAEEIYIAGGATRSDLFLQMHADVCNLPVKVGDFDNSPLLGCAILASVGCGYFQGDNQLDQAVNRFVKIVKEVQPLPENVKRYNKFYSIYRKAISAVKDISLELVKSNNDHDNDHDDGNSNNDIHDNLLSSKREAIIEPSILSADYGYLAEDAMHCENANAKYLHIDMCDGGKECQRSLTIGPATIAAIHKKVPTMKLDVHVVVNDSIYFIESLAKVGTHRIIFQYEQMDNVDKAIEFATLVRDSGMKCGVCIKPQTPVSDIELLLQSNYKDDTMLIEMVDILAVGPGLANQKFDVSVLSKIQYLYQTYPHLVHIAVDGGINEETAKLSAAAGANLLIAGSFVFGYDRKHQDGHSPLAKNINKLMNTLMKYGK